MATVVAPISSPISAPISGVGSFPQGGDNALVPTLFVRADGTATYATATDSSSASTSMGLAELYTALDNGDITSGTVVGLSSAGGDFAAANVSATSTYSGDTGTNPGQLHLFPGVTYVNVEGEDVVFDKAGLNGLGGEVRNIVANETGAGGSIIVAATGSITIQGINGTTAAECFNGLQGTGHKLWGLIHGDNDDDIYCLNGGSICSVDVRPAGGTGPTVGPSSQLFTTHSPNHTITASGGASFTGFRSGVIAAGGNISITDIDFAEPISNGFGTHTAGGTVTLNNCNITSNAGVAISIGAHTSPGTYTFNNCTITYGTDITNQTWGASGGTETPAVEFNSCNFVYTGTGGQTSFDLHSDITWNDCYYDLTAASPTRVHNNNGPVTIPRIQWNRCTVDIGNVNRSITFFRWNSEAATCDPANGSGFHSGQIIGGMNLGLVLFNQGSNIATNFTVEQTTFYNVTGCTAVYNGFDGTGDIEFYNCHFTGSTATLIDYEGVVGSMEASALNCSFHTDAPWNGDPAKNDQDTSGLSDVQEGFANKAYTGYDLSITSSSSLYHAGGTPRSTSANDITNTPFDTPAASTGAYEAV